MTTVLQQNGQWWSHVVPCRFGERTWPHAAHAALARTVVVPCGPMWSHAAHVVPPMWSHAAMASAQATPTVRLPRATSLIAPHSLQAGSLAYQRISVRNEQRGVADTSAPREFHPQARTGVITSPREGACFGTTRPKRAAHVVRPSAAGSDGPAVRDARCRVPVEFEPEADPKSIHHFRPGVVEKHTAIQDIRSQPAPQLHPYPMSQARVPAMFLYPVASPQVSLLDTPSVGKTLVSQQRRAEKNEKNTGRVQVPVSIDCSAEQLPSNPLVERQDLPAVYQTQDVIECGARNCAGKNQGLHDQSLETTDVGSIEHVDERPVGAFDSDYPQNSSSAVRQGSENESFLSPRCGPEAHEKPTTDWDLIEELDKFCTRKSTGPAINEGLVASMPKTEHVEVQASRISRVRFDLGATMSDNAEASSVGSSDQHPKGKLATHRRQQTLKIGRCDVDAVFPEPVECFVHRRERSVAAWAPVRAALALAAEVHESDTDTSGPETLVGL